MNDLTVEIQNSLWKDENQLLAIKKIYGSNLSNEEFNTFLQIGMSTNLNPFMREIWAVKYGSSPAQIFVGRDGYRKVIGRNPNFNGIVVDSVYSNDDFEVNLGEGKVIHKYGLKDRGKLVGAYCMVSMKNIDKPFYVFSPIGEYNTGKSLWVNKPDTMIRKVSESQAIRMAIPTMFNGTYSDSEIWEDKTPVMKKKRDMYNEITEIDTPEQIEEVKNIYENNSSFNDNEVIVSDVLQLVKDKYISDAVINKWFEKANVSSFDEMSLETISKIWEYLKNL